MRVSAASVTSVISIASTFLLVASSDWKKKGVARRTTSTTSQLTKQLLLQDLLINVKQSHAVMEGKKQETEYNSNYLRLKNDPTNDRQNNIPVESCDPDIGILSCGEGLECRDGVCVSKTRFLQDDYCPEACECETDAAAGTHTFVCSGYCVQDSTGLEVCGVVTYSITNLTDSLSVTGRWESNDGTQYYSVTQAFDAMYNVTECSYTINGCDCECTVGSCPYIEGSTSASLSCPGIADDIDICDGGILKLGVCD